MSAERWVAGRASAVLWRQARTKLVTRRDLFEHLRVPTHSFYSPHWTALLETLLKKRLASALTRAPTPT